MKKTTFLNNVVILSVLCAGLASADVTEEDFKKIDPAQQKCANGFIKTSGKVLDTISKSARGCHKTIGEEGGGALALQKLVEHAERVGVDVQYDMQVDALVM